MMALFEKDLRLIFIRKSAIYIYLLIGAVFTWEFSSSFSGAYLTMLGTMLALSTLSYDDSDNCMEFIFTLPCTRKQYVIEKYLFVYGFSFIAGLIGMMIIIISSFIKGVPVNATMFMDTICSELPILAITGGLMIPLQLKFGPEKTRIILMLMLGVIFILGFLLTKLPGTENIYESTATLFNSINPISLLILLVVILIIFGIISVFVSMKIMDSKEY